MRTVPGMHVEWVEGEAVVLNPTTKELHYLNAQAALVYALVGELGWQGALEALRARYGSLEGFEEDLSRLVSDMEAKGLLSDD
jgi:hypothetical protein